MARGRQKPAETIAFFIVGLIVGYWLLLSPHGPFSPSFKKKQQTELKQDLVATAPPQASPNTTAPSSSLHTETKDFQPAVVEMSRLDSRLNELKKVMSRNYPTRTSTEHVDELDIEVAKRLQLLTSIAKMKVAVDDPALREARGIFEQIAKDDRHPWLIRRSALHTWSRIPVVTTETERETFLAELEPSLRAASAFSDRQLLRLLMEPEQ